MALRPRRKYGFTIVELLVVIGLIALLIAMLLPALKQARAQAYSVQCKSNLREIYANLVIYSNNWKGWMFPPGLGWDPAIPPDARWPAQVFKPAKWNPPIMICPSDYQPAGEHSYVLNNHLANKGPKFTNKVPGKSGSEVVLMGEKKTEVEDYYMELSSFTASSLSDFFRVVEKYRHGVKLGSNYLFKDGHVEITPPNGALAGIDPWDVPVSPTTLPSDDPVPPTP